MAAVGKQAAFVSASLTIHNASSLASGASEVACGARGAIIVRNAVRVLRWPARLPPEDIDVTDIRITINLGATQVTSDDARRLPPVALRALRELALAHASATNVHRVVGRVAVVRGTRCPRLHVDKVRLRTIATIFGPGTVVAPRDAIDMEALLSQYSVNSIPKLCSSSQEHDAYLLTAPDRLVKLNAGDVAFLVGAGSDTNNLDLDVASVHRSPRRPAHCRRLIVQIDDAPENDVQHRMPLES
jgi:hypothetical protein